MVEFNLKEKSGIMKSPDLKFASTPGNGADSTAAKKSKTIRWGDDMEIEIIQRKSSRKQSKKQTLSLTDLDNPNFSLSNLPEQTPIQLRDIKGLREGSTISPIKKV
mmetsp:Transcript_39276/g.34970  ORF Transcript_39276/g.34970 Transcript_39276/m.34970 type:complete len:106 (+) Transcript_39276:263-580(+)|eukprot:CAMPEP_0114582528 /NCGR_PEP_ID=MMETSP0125-20121206/6486_1 /TAXON_ID=485358 ORGANISM="Aristerostoma sp., Strain ATCC 50986" /NCGR_SAMPLE_ID=MMETSP0125 /ASSEMBLY_ACC=CAM_ASM_000245 /LENGTH=105 /DNA_ID=CAMNT_0001775525 /DNA_START=252 /DNA_END=569 /DNA_ORIENTATION=-